ncbi:MAG: RagB/SusD family nutrient uptake outer membrane protein [Parabacteroides sp.]|nr:RagB/SusD family nutrient uptake outer membrane protein [Parabacteroides sp.]
MKMKNIKYWAFAAMLGLGATSCEDFLNRPTEDGYNVDNFYQNDEQCIQGVNYLYNSPWYDFQRGFIKVGEVFSGNYYMGSSPYLDFTVNSTDADLSSMSSSLWAVVGHANTVYNNLKNASGTASEAVKNQCMGECLAWKSFAYFFLVRSFGDIPIIHDNSEELADGSYNSKYKVQKADVYEYIVMTLEKAIELLPASTSFDGRIDKYAAEALLAKVYLTKSGVSGTRNADDLAKAAEYAKDVIDNSGRRLLDNYSDVFRLKNNTNQECLISWLWYATREPWTAQNTLQSDLAMVGFDEFGDCWGGYGGMSVDLQDAFGVSALDDPNGRIENDSRRKATMMLAGDTYDYFWTDKGGFDYLRFIYDSEDYGKGGPGGTLQSATGANSVKHLYGNTNDHVQGSGMSPQYMCSGLATHLLRLSDLYLIYAEAKMGTASSTSDAGAIDAFYQVRHRAIPSYQRPTSVTWEDVWKERRLELAMEGDRWYDYVRLSYYDAPKAIDELKAQRRNEYYDLNTPYKGYYENGTWTYDAQSTRYNTDTAAPNVTLSSFTLPFPSEDAVFNPNLLKEPIHIDVRSEYSY